jgi:hypothetical protein
MRWLYATPSSAPGTHRLVTACRRSLGLMSIAGVRASGQAKNQFGVLHDDYSPELVFEPLCALLSELGK